MVAVAATVANAVAAALAHFGIKVNELPLTPVRLWQVLGEAMATSHSDIDRLG